MAGRIGIRSLMGSMMSLSLSRPSVRADFEQAVGAMPSFLLVALGRIGLLKHLLASSGMMRRVAM